MHKHEFLAQLRKGLSGLPRDDVEERLSFYSEMIDDQMEEGLSEEEAVSAAGSVDEIVAQTIAETPLAKIAKERMSPGRRLSTGELVLLVLGSPIWLSLMIAALAVIFSLYVSLWAVVISLWAVFAAFAACSAGGVLACVIFIADSYRASGVAMLAAGLVCAGLSIFMFYGCRAVTNGALVPAGKLAMRIKNCFIKKEAAG